MQLPLLMPIVRVMSYERKNKKRRDHGKPGHRAPKAHQKHDQKQGQKQQERGRKAPKIKADLFGFHACAEAWLNPERDIHALYITQNALSGFESVIEKAKKAKITRPAPTITDKGAIDNALMKGTVHQGVALDTAPLPMMGLPDLLIRTQDKPSALLVILDQVTDPHNVGAIARSACAFGADGIITQSRHTPDLSGVLAKIACGALEHVPFAAETNLARTIEELQQNHFIVLALDERGEHNIDVIAERHKNDKIAFVMGAEGPGIRRLVKEKCDDMVRLPMDGAMPSINVSNAAAIALYAFRAID